MFKHLWLACVLACGMSCFVMSRHAAAAQTVLASRGGGAAHVVISAHANEAVKALADELARKLSQMLDVEVKVTTGDGRAGVVLAQQGDFDHLPAIENPQGTHPLAAAQSYRLQTDGKRVVVVGASEAGVAFGMWDLLGRLGYRQLAPHEAWEIVPDLQAQRVVLDLDETQTPDYFDRRVWYAWGGDATRKQVWNFKNRMNQHGHRVDYMPYMPDRWKRTLVDNQHMYYAIIRANKQAFDEHPEYYALVKGERKGSKMCISNPAVQQMAADYALDYFKKNPDNVSMSMEPTDGYGWCECEACAQLGSISTRMVILANHVARALEQDHGDKYLGVLAYAHHTLPPDVDVHPKVVVTCATQLSGNVPIEERLAGWGKRAQTLGIYEYVAVAQWHASMPGRMRGGDTAYLSRMLPRFHELGARMFVGEAGDCWGPNALGYYLTSKLLWSVAAAEQKDAIVQDFLDKGFGPAAEVMGAWYQLMDNSYNAATTKTRPGSIEYFQERVPVMYRLLLKAKDKAAGRPDVLARLDHLLLYTRYVELRTDFSTKVRKQKGDTPQTIEERSAEARERLIHFSWQIRDTGMAHWHGARGATPHGTKVKVADVPAWADADHQDKAYWQDITPKLLAEVTAQARQAAATAEAAGGTH